jgi:hypothetical protein
MQRELLALISEVIPAAQGAILLHSSVHEEASPPCIWNRNGRAEPEMHIRDELVQRATSDRCAVFAAVPAETVATEH